MHKSCQAAGILRSTFQRLLTSVLDILTFHRQSIDISWQSSISSKRHFPGLCSPLSYPVRSVARVPCGFPYCSSSVCSACQVVTGSGHIAPTRSLFFSRNAEGAWNRSKQVIPWTRTWRTWSRYVKICQDMSRHSDLVDHNLPSCSTVVFSSFAGWICFYWFPMNEVHHYTRHRLPIYTSLRTRLHKRINARDAWPYDLGNLRKSLPCHATTSPSTPGYSASKKLTRSFCSLINWFV